MSIVINNYNYAEFLGDCIESALGQTTAATEVVVVDDGSTDKSRQVIERYRPGILPVFKANAGQSSAFNAGYAVTTGTVVIFLDADDLLLSTAIEQVCPFFNDEAVSKVHWPLLIIDRNGRQSGKLRPHQILPQGDLRDHLIAKGPGCYLSPPTSGNAWSRARFLRAVMPLPEIGDGHGADAFLITLAPLYGTLGRVETPQGCYRTHARSFTGRLVTGHIRRNKDRFDRLADSLTEHLDKFGIPADRAAWKRESWLDRAAETLRDLEHVIPVGEQFAIVNDCELGTGEIIDGREALPFPDRDGEYWGAPASDTEAIAALDRLMKSGVSLIAIGWPSFWWFDHYPQWRRNLYVNAECLLENERVVVFRLKCNPQ